MDVLSEFIAYLSGLRASSVARMGQDARDKERDAVGQPLQTGPEGLRCTPANRQAVDLESASIQKGMKKHIGKSTRKKRGFLLGNPLEKGTKIIPCMSHTKTSLVEVRDILVWELGQTCEAARNGTRKVLELQKLS
ncbi:hypothetical protein bpr_IV169 (plasmid) [Butyrivibrio proteoclasticus B316]|uniref:Uncharacterized protein n=1 Tax=Butyrivibrio proteoclasticus (strain ATCC 51982 / DSM 14932 / B316) TaxID=515622 RepID=E0S551_BUTPB|nr:hypothetical protein bpr_IV169 [Butyrivibrio proteoclasticus B316]